MRWFFLLLFVLNVFYYVWHQQQSPLRPKEVAPLISAQDSKHDIHLLSESDRHAPQGRTAIDGADTSLCLYLTGFELAAAAAAVEQRLLSLDIRAHVQPVDTAAEVDYWVYLPPLASRQASLRQLKELQARKIDSYIITQGDLANGISLGIFPREDSAKSVMQRLGDAGYESKLRELPRAHRSYRLRIAPESRRLVSDTLLQTLAYDFKGLQHQIMPCGSIASPL